MKVWITNAIWIHRLVCWCNTRVYAQADENQRVIACIGDGSFQVIISSYKTSIICDSYMVHKNLGPNWYMLHFNYKCMLGHTIWTWRTGSRSCSRRWYISIQLKKTQVIKLVLYLVFRIWNFVNTLVSRTSYI